MLSSILSIIIIVCVLTESVLITAFGLRPFPKAILQAVVANLLSVLLVYMIWPVMARLNVDEGKLFPLLPILIVSTIISETLILKLFNRTARWSRVLLISCVMNLVSFIVLYGLLQLL